MKKKKYSSLKELTDSKLRYSQLYLDELKNPKIASSEGEKAHQQSFLFHLNGVVDAFYAELNEIYSLGIKDKKISLESLKNAKSDSKKSIKEAKKISKLLGKKNWLAEVKSFNPQLPQINKKAKKIKGKTKEEPSSLVEQINQSPSNPVLEKFEEWQAKMRKLVSELRESALHANGHSPKK